MSGKRRTDLSAPPNHFARRPRGLSHILALSLVALGVSFSVPTTPVGALPGGLLPSAIAPVPANAGEPHNSNVTGVSCTGAGDCTIVGYYPPSSRTVALNGGEFVESETSGVWQGFGTITLPSDGSYGPRLNGVSCTSAGNCIAVGYVDLNNYVAPFALTESSGTWEPGIELSSPQERRKVLSSTR